MNSAFNCDKSGALSPERRKSGKNRLAFLGEMPLLVRIPGIGPGRI